MNGFGVAEVHVINVTLPVALKPRREKSAAAGRTLLI